MSWTPELYIGGLRPWPDAVRVIRSQTDESKTYVPDRTATRKVISYGAIGRCNCSACNWCVDPFDAYCRRCGARFVGTEYTHCREEDE